MYKSVVVHDFNLDGADARAPASKAQPLSPHEAGAVDVAILLDHFGPGGVERVACHLANSLAQRGLRVEMVVLRDEGPVRGLLDEVVSVRVLGCIRGLKRGNRFLAAVPALARYLRERRPALLHSPGNHTHVAAALGMRLAGFSGAFVPKITNPVLKDGLPWWRQALRRQL